MDILCQSDHNCNATLSKSKIPDYARDYRNEYLFIRGINKSCENFVKRLDVEGKIFNSPQANELMLYLNKFLKAQQLEYINDISELYFKENDVRFIESLELQLDDYTDLYCNPDSYEFDQEKYDNNVENDYPGFKKFFKCFSRFQDKLNVDYLSERDFDKLPYLDSDSDDDGGDSDSDSDDDGVDSDDIKDILNGCEDSESDSDSD